MKADYLVCINSCRAPKGCSFMALFSTPSDGPLTSFPSLPVCIALQGTHQDRGPVRLRGHLPQGAAKQGLKMSSSLELTPTSLLRSNTEGSQDRPARGRVRSCSEETSQTWQLEARTETRHLINIWVGFVVFCVLFYLGIFPRNVGYLMLLLSRSAL